MSTFMQVGFPVDLEILKRKSSTTGTAAAWQFVDRLRGNSLILTSTAIAAESTSTNPTYVFNSNTIDGIDVALAGTAGSYVGYSFKRAPGFFDVVCYTGTGSVTTQAHNLTVAPELMIVKARNVGGFSAATYFWQVQSKLIPANQYLTLNSTAAAATGADRWNSTYAGATTFTLGNAPEVNESSSVNYVAYLFATLAGISKVGSYTGNGTSQNIECGFAAGARFVLIKCTSTTGDWYVWDTARGIVVDTEPHLSLNTTAAEVTTDDSVDPYSPGFTVNQVAATNINVTSATYIFLAIS